MIGIRLKYPLSFHHAEIPAGTVITVPAEIARMFIAREVAEAAEPEYAVIQPQETRTVPARIEAEESRTSRARGRPRKNG